MATTELIGMWFLLMNLSAAFTSILIDDFNYETQPFTCRRPNSLAAIDVFTDSATVKWNERDTSTQWEIQYDVSGFPIRKWKYKCCYKRYSRYWRLSEEYGL